MYTRKENERGGGKRGEGSKYGMEDGVGSHMKEVQ